MKTELERPEEQLERQLEGEAWHGPSVLEVLDGVSAHQAAAHPIAGAHSIWEGSVAKSFRPQKILRELYAAGYDMLGPKKLFATLPPFEQGRHILFQEMNSRRVMNELKDRL